MPEISAEALAELGRLALQVGHDPKTRRDFFKAVQKVAPERYAAQADMVMQDQLDTLREELATERLQRKGDEIRVRTEAARAALLSRYSDDDVKKIEAIMSEVGISDYERGARLYASEVAPAAPANSPPRPSPKFDFPTGFDALVKDPQGAARETAFAVIDELKKARPR